jgi:hypothetical protein
MIGLALERALVVVRPLHQLSLDAGDERVVAAGSSRRPHFLARRDRRLEFVPSQLCEDFVMTSRPR